MINWKVRIRNKNFWLALIPAVLLRGTERHPDLREVEPGHFLACHFPQRKIDENGNYLFELPKMERKSIRGVEEPAAEAAGEQK